jgi:hypothetical protein
MKAASQVLRHGRWECLCLLSGDVSSPVEMEFRNISPTESYPTKFDAYLEGTACLSEDGAMAQDRH